MFVRILRHELRLAFAQKTAWMNALLFFALVILLFPLALGASATNLAQMAPGLIWVTALLATFLSLESLFREDFADGTLEWWCANKHGLLMYAYAKLCAHWLVFLAPLWLISPMLALSLHLPAEALPTLLVSLFLGTLAMVWLGAIGVAITTGLKYNSFLLALLTLPFYVPVLIFGAGAVALSADGLAVAGPLYLLAALAVFAVTLSPLAVAKALKLSIT
ncbi:MAG: heme exporter protein CcmB [Thiomicrospira sp.]|jgi:heme exporter protein B|nr:heme exporter protein CcmB [Thiomicrospira sp.]